MASAPLPLREPSNYVLTSLLSSSRGGALAKAVLRSGCCPFSYSGSHLKEVPLSRWQLDHKVTNGALLLLPEESSEAGNSFPGRKEAFVYNPACTETDPSCQSALAPCWKIHQSVEEENLLGERVPSVAAGCLSLPPLPKYVDGFSSFLSRTAWM